MGEITVPNSTYKKLAVQWLNEALCFVSSSVLADSFKKGGIQLNNQYQGIWNNYVDVHNTTWKYYVLEI